VGAHISRVCPPTPDEQLRPLLFLDGRGLCLAAINRKNYRAKSLLASHMAPLRNGTAFYWRGGAIWVGYPGSKSTRGSHNRKGRLWLNLGAFPHQQCDHRFPELLDSSLDELNPGQCGIIYQSQDAYGGILNSPRSRRPRSIAMRTAQAKNV